MESIRLPQWMCSRTWRALPKPSKTPESRSSSAFCRAAASLAVPAACVRHAVSVQAMMLYDGAACSAWTEARHSAAGGLARHA